MFNTTMIVRGRLTKDPELRFTASGLAVASLSVVDQPQKFDKESKKWVDQEPIFWDTTLWRDEAENAAEGLSKGDDVVLIGRPIMDAYTDREGVAQKRMKFQADAVAVQISKFQTVKVTRANRSSQPRVRQEEKPVDPWGIDHRVPAEEPPF